jgi:fructose-1,6-bisphosphatase/inositol monophosphatase family enzyme
MEINQDHVLEILRENAQKNILPYFKALTQDQIREKKPGDLVTDADEASELFLTDKLSKLLPYSKVVGEEAVARDKTVLNLINDDTLVWVVDPIDGTYNFAHGRSKWGVLLSLVHKNEVIFGVLYDVLNEKIIFAKRGEGCHLVMPDDAVSQIKLQKKETDIKEYIGHTDGRQTWCIKKLNDLCKEVHNIRCSLHDCWGLLSGEIDFTLHHSVTAWDHSAPFLAVEEAGGYIRAGWDKQRFSSRAIGHGYLLATYDEEKWDELAETLFKAMSREKQLS